MIKSILIFSIFLFFSTISNAQIFNIKTIDGTTQKIHVSHEVGDQKLVIASLKDTLIVDDFIGFSEDIFILKESFLCIHYTVRTGSDQSREMLLMLCAKNNKICEALHILYSSTYDIVSVFDKKLDSLKPFNEHSEYEVKISLTYTDQKHYKLQVNIHDQSESKGNYRTNHNNSILLNFDDSMGIFYNAQDELSKYFQVYDAKTERRTRQFILGTFPAIELNEINYYYIRGEWYEEGYDDNLTKNTYKQSLNKKD